MLDLMFAAALSGTRAAEAARASQPQPIDYSLAPVTERKVEEKDWRTFVGGLSFKDESDWPIFFQKEVDGFGMVRVASRCASEEGAGR